MRLKTTLVAILLCLAWSSPGVGQTLGELPTVTVTGSTDQDIQHAVNVLGLLNPNASPTGKVVIPAGTYTISSTITVTGSYSPKNLQIHCEPGAVLQVANTWTSLSPILQFQDLSSSSALGSLRVDGCVFDMSTAAPPSQQNAVGISVLVNSDGPGTSNTGNVGTIEIDHNEFRHSSLQGVLLQTPLNNFAGTQNVTQLLTGANIHDNICHDMYSVSVSGSSNPACFESKNTVGTIYRANYMYNFPNTSGTTPVFGILCNGDNGCSLERNVCSYNTSGGASSAACYKGLFMSGYMSAGNSEYGNGDCQSWACSFAEHCDTCISPDSHDNFYYNVNSCARFEVNQDDNIHDNTCYLPAELGYYLTTREGNSSSDTVIANQLINTTGLVSGNAAVISLGNPGITPPLGTCSQKTWNSTMAVSLTVGGSTAYTGLLVSQQLASGQIAWITSPILEICVESSPSATNAVPSPGGSPSSNYLQFVLSDTCTGTGCATSLASPHTTINFPGFPATTWTPVYGWSDAFGFNFNGTTRGVLAWGIVGTSIPVGTVITLSVFAHDVPFMRHQFHNNHIVRAGQHALYLAGALQNFNIDHNLITDPGFSSSGTIDAIRLDSTLLNGGHYPMQNGQVSDNTITDNGGKVSRNGIHYLDLAVQPINKVRSFHNFFQGSFTTTNSIVYDVPSSIQDAYYTVSGVQQLSGVGTFTLTFPANGFLAAPFCLASDQTAAAAVRANPSPTQLSLQGAANDFVAYECRSQSTE